MVTIRKGTVEDIPVLHDFNVRLARETEDKELHADDLERGLQAAFADAAKSQYFVAVGDDDQGEKIIIGCLSFTFEWSDWRNGTVLWLQNVYVKQSHRKRRVFRLLFDHVMKMVNDDPSVNGLRLFAYNANATAHKTYKAMGMTGDRHSLFEIMK